MVATGWVCSEHMAEERVHFSGERERARGEVKRELRADSRERGEKCNLGI